MNPALAVMLAAAVHVGDPTNAGAPTVTAAPVEAESPAIATRLGAWLGRWTGDATVATPSGVRQRFRMELNITATDDSRRLGWELVYITSDQGEERRQVRPYSLIEIDGSQGRYQVDEHNGIVIPTVLIDGVLHACFVVQGNQISVSYRLHEAPVGADDPPAPRLIVEMVTTDTKRPATTGDRDGAPPVVTLPTRSVQRAVLMRQP